VSPPQEDHGTICHQLHRLDRRGSGAESDTERRREDVCRKTGEGDTNFKRPIGKNVLIGVGWRKHALH
jgi:hypothetical protein